CARGYYAMDYW
nr:immunoglobulin heavy chain junction region [Mus musculus]MBK4195317.1 immunoglobulin heavy chain junction region [Mus musculus]